MSSIFDKQSWQPKASFETLRLRARVYAAIREFFQQRDVWEVDTPSLSMATTTDPNIQSFETHFLGSGELRHQPMYLITSPEFHMKRLLAAGSGSIYQICHVFRQSELGSQHNPEFAMLEWYRVSMSYRDLMNEVAELVAMLMESGQLESEFLTYQQAFLQYAQIDPLAVTLEDLRHLAQRAGLSLPSREQEDRDFYLDFLMSTQVQPQLGQGRLTFIYEYPASQCALARIAKDNTQVAERFELFIDGVELANGFHELADAEQQLYRFQAELKRRAEQGMTPPAIDQHLIAALESGLPDCSGVALGLDRLIQFISAKKSLKDVLAFPFNRA